MLLLAVAAALVAPEPLFQDSWFSPYLDIPRKGLKPDTWTIILIELTVNTQGNAVSCAARVVEGNPNMGPYTCRRMMSRARFHPARDESGQKTYGLYRTAVRWWNGTDPPKRDNEPHFLINVRDWPIAGHSAVTTGIRFAVDESGRVTNCNPGYGEPTKAELEDPEKIRSWQSAPVACAQMMRIGSVPPAKTRGGEPVRSIQTATIRLERAR